MGSETSKMSDAEGAEGEIKDAQSTVTKKEQLIIEEHDTVSGNATQTKPKTPKKDENDVLHGKIQKTDKEIRKGQIAVADANASFSDISETELSDGEEAAKAAEVEKLTGKISDTSRTSPPTGMGDTSDISETELSDGNDAEPPTKVKKAEEKIWDTKPVKIDDTSDVSETELSEGEDTEKDLKEPKDEKATSTAPGYVDADDISDEELSELDKSGTSALLETEEVEKAELNTSGTAADEMDAADLTELDKSDTSVSLEPEQVEKAKLNTSGTVDDEMDAADSTELDKSGTSVSMEAEQVEKAEPNTSGTVDEMDAADSNMLDSMEVADIVPKTDEADIVAVAGPEVGATIFSASCAEKDAQLPTEDMETTTQKISPANADKAHTDEGDTVVQAAKEITSFSPIPEKIGAVTMDISESGDNSISFAKDTRGGDSNAITTESMIASSPLTEKDQPALDDAITADVNSSNPVEADEVQETELEASAKIKETEEADISVQTNDGPSITEKSGEEKDVGLIKPVAVDEKAQEPILADDDSPAELSAESITEKQQIASDGPRQSMEGSEEAEEEIIFTAVKSAVESNEGKGEEGNEDEEKIIFTAVKPAEEEKKNEKEVISTAVRATEETQGDEKKIIAAAKLTGPETPNEESAVAGINTIKEPAVGTNSAEKTISVQEDESTLAKKEESTEEKHKADGEPKHIEEEAKPVEESKDPEGKVDIADKPVSAVDILIAEVLAPEDAEVSPELAAQSVENMELDEVPPADITSSIVNEANESQESTSSNLVIDEKFDTTDTTEPSNSISEDPSTAVASKETAIKESANAEESAQPTKVIEIEDEVMEVDTPKPADDSVMIIEIDDDDDDVVPEKTPENAETSESLLIPSKLPEGATPRALDVEDAIKSATVATTSNEAEVETVDHEVYYNKTCINYNCPQQHKQYYRAPRYALSYFKVSKKNFKPQFVCSDCCDVALDAFELMCGTLHAKQPLFLANQAEQSQEAVNIIVSSDEENDDHDAQAGKQAFVFAPNELELIEQELTRSIKNVFDTVAIQNQLTWSKALLTARLKCVEEENMAMDEEINGFKGKLDKMYNSLYQYPKIRVHHQQPIDGNTGQPYCTEESDAPQIPPFGEVIRPPIQPNENYYAVKNKAIASWVPCKVIEQTDNVMGGQKNLKHYKIKYLKATYQMVKTVSNKHMAYYRPPNVRLNTGERVIAYFDANSISPNKEKLLVQSAFYPGIIAEPLRESNRYRYLIFYDDGYTQYVQHKDVRLVCNVSEKVWEDVHVGSREFIESYLTQHTINRPMVQTQKGQNMSAESNGKWTYARVIDIDCSLIQMHFETVKNVPHTEWIYRGSMRLGPVFHEHRKRLQQAETSNAVVSRNHRRHEPYVRYAEDEESKKSGTIQEGRAVARKSLGRPPSTGIAPAAPTTSLGAAKESSAPTVRHLNNSTIYVDDDAKPKGKVVYYTTKHPKVPRKFVPHKCGPACLNYDKKDLRAYSPFSKPILLGWERMLVKQKIKKFVAYRGPCGKIMRNMKELRLYLRQTDNILNVDQFDFSPDINCLAEYTIETQKIFMRDISRGQEKVHIPLVNYYDSSLPPECKYAAQRIPTEGVPLNLDEEFLVGCDCEDDCSDKSKCSCWQLTLAGARYGNPNTPTDEIGYQYKRLHEHVPTGIYECNSRCKCKSNCLNRVVQHMLEMRLQVFKTSNRGWGLRCLNDIPKGSFICIYAGHLLTEAKANEGGLDAGDEYFAELDYIEVAEQIKEGYESEVETDVEPEEEEEESFSQEQDDDDEFTPSKSFMTRSRAHRSRNARMSLNDEDSQERQVINFNPNSDLKETSGRDSSMRSLFGKDEACYVMDAKVMGNLGRYFNHSCTPNLFVQNVFVDTHDLRFPWVAFFSSMNIRAGTELTWNYNYEVGVVPGKVLYCQCGTPNCRGRLL